MVGKLIVLIFCGFLAITPPGPGNNLPDIRANELGKVLVLEYHLIQPAETRWGRSVDNFRRDLETLYAGGFRPIGVKDFVDGKIDLPAGRKPMILTFDDSSPGQMRYIAESGSPRIDPQCAVGMLLEFHEKHPDFALKAIFFVLPEAKQPHKLFGQPEYEKKKLNELVSLGFEIGNHTYWHANLAKYPGTVVQKQLALAQDAVARMVPGYRLEALSLPLGEWPRDPALALSGSYKGIEYRHKAVFLVSGGPALSPFDSKCQFTRLPRIQVTGNELQHWLKYLGAHPEEVFVSDGDPARITCPASQLPRLAKSRFPNLKITTAN